MLICSKIVTHLEQKEILSRCRLCFLYLKIACYILRSLYLIVIIQGLENALCSKVIHWLERTEFGRKEVDTNPVLLISAWVLLRFLSFLDFLKLGFYFPSSRNSTYLWNNYCKFFFFQMQVLTCCSFSTDTVINLLYEMWEIMGGVDGVVVMGRGLLRCWIIDYKVTIGTNHPGK